MTKFTLSPLPPTTLPTPSLSYEYHHPTIQNAVAARVIEEGASAPGVTSLSLADFIKVGCRCGQFCFEKGLIFRHRHASTDLVEYLSTPHLSRTTKYGSFPPSQPPCLSYFMPNCQTMLFVLASFPGGHSDHGCRRLRRQADDPLVTEGRPGTTQRACPRGGRASEFLCLGSLDGEPLFDRMVLATTKRVGKSKGTRFRIREGGTRSGGATEGGVCGRARRLRRVMFEHRTRPPTTLQTGEFRLLHFGRSLKWCLLYMFAEFSHGCRYYYQGWIWGVDSGDVSRGSAIRIFLRAFYYGKDKHAELLLYARGRPPIREFTSGQVLFSRHRRAPASSAPRR